MVIVMNATAPTRLDEFWRLSSRLFGLAYRMLGRVADDLRNMEGMDDQLLEALVKHGIRTMEDLAEQSIDDLLGVGGLDEERAAALIMKAREPWFADQGGDA